MSAAVTGSLRLERAFAGARAERRLAIVIYLTVGYPDRASTAPLLRAALDGGADILELGVPFSDPLADGTTVQRAGEVALRQGVTLADCIAEAAAVIRERDCAALLMGYTNPFLQYGYDRLARDLAQSGIAGVIVPDMPAEESGDLDHALAREGGVRIDLYAPTTPDERLARLLPSARGFVYCVSLTGVTGARAALAGDVAQFVARVRRHTTLPIVVGFGISGPDHVAALRGIAGVVVGSAAIDTVTRAAPERRAEALRSFVAALAAAGSD
ncbi:MAG TPA: tryptophan synthase subunit alpha [Candidatus Limnocylindria bacterium]|jgi:tryptophan synthase alpha chain|nr:tryptophan synthase subunit alpha [Candidatus Limnocylindria bacterium]